MCDTAAAGGQRSRAVRQWAGRIAVRGCRIPNRRLRSPPGSASGPGCGGRLPRGRGRRGRVLDSAGRGFQSRAEVGRGRPAIVSGSGAGSRGSHLDNDAPVATVRRTLVSAGGGSRRPHTRGGPAGWRADPGPRTGACSRRAAPPAGQRGRRPGLDGEPGTRTNRGCPGHPRQRERSVRRGGRSGGHPRGRGFLRLGWIGRAVQSGQATIGVATLGEVEAVVEASHAGTITLVAAEPSDGVGAGPGSARS